MYYFVKDIIFNNGKKWSKILTKRYSLISGLYRGIKDIILYNKSQIFLDQFKETGLHLSKSIGTNAALSQAPRYFIELLTFGGMVLIMLSVAYYDVNKFIEIIPVLSVFGIASVKLLPAFQNLYVSISQIKSNIVAFDSVENDLIQDTLYSNIYNSKKCFSQDDVIHFTDVCYAYPNSNINVIKNFSLSLKPNCFYGIVGPSGSGKSTLASLIAGLLQPSSGHISVGNEIINKENIYNYHKLFGIMHQDVVLFDDTILNNIIMSDNSPYDGAKLSSILNTCLLTEFTKSLPNGLNTFLDERNSNISGGQRQRIGLARLLYSNRKFLIFDESTSALDENTENIILNNLLSQNYNKTIILITHNIQNLSTCQNILYVNNNKISIFPSLTHFNKLISK